ncbi:MAG: hypothetical protein KKF36_05430 [Alphaproteobacteria bacterium]|nr:hypothetical protein [Alphaproteobacteria bacterium]
MESLTGVLLEEFMPDLDELIDWMDALELYARDWDQTFGEQTNYFTQEFWYMLIGCVRAHWAGHPLTVSQLTQRMKSGSNRTREERIKRAVDDGYLIKVRDDQDGRASYVRPTPELETMVIGHLMRTLARVRETMQRSKAPQ